MEFNMAFYLFSQTQIRSVDRFPLEMIDLLSVHCSLNFLPFHKNLVVFSELGNRYSFKCLLYLIEINQMSLEMTAWVKGLRPVLEGFVVPMHEGACETRSQIPRVRDVLFAQARVHWDNKPRQIGLNHDYNMTFSISPVSNLVVKGAYVLEARAVSRAPPFVTSRGAP